MCCSKYILVRSLWDPGHGSHPIQLCGWAGLLQGIFAWWDPVYPNPSKLSRMMSVLPRGEGGVGAEAHRP